MHPSSILSFEPGLEHGAPWGRDLFTFVTSAAGHMMRTLQRPRKNKPTKRQVNHRRFLHNMIQRKFAQIEAANHQLATSLFSTEKSSNYCSAKPSLVLTEVRAQSSNPSLKAPNPEEDQTILEQEDMRNLWTLDCLLETQVIDRSSSHGKLQNTQHRRMRSDKDLRYCSSVEKDADTTDVSSSLSDNWLENFDRTTSSKQNAGLEIHDLAPLSPVISVLSLNSCDLELQMLIDAKNSVHTETMQIDLMDFDLLDCSDSHGDPDSSDRDADLLVFGEEDKQEASTFPGSLGSEYNSGRTPGFGSGIKIGTENDSLDISFYGKSISSFNQNDQVCTADNRCYQASQSFHSNQTNSPENDFNCLTPCFMTNEKDLSIFPNTDVSMENKTVLDYVAYSHFTEHQRFPESVIQQDIPSKRTFLDNRDELSRLGTYENYSHCPGADQNPTLQDDDQNLSSPFPHCLEQFCFNKESDFQFQGHCSGHNFEGVARSFPASIYKIHPPPVSTPPLDDDWLFNCIEAEVGAG